jgi:hypothetical protein
MVLNLTIASLAIASSYLRAPFFSPASLTQNHYFQLSTSHFRHWTSEFLRTQATGSFAFLDSSFRSFMSRALSFESNGKREVTLFGQRVRQQKKIDWRNVTVIGCEFESCQADTGGAIGGSHINMTFIDTAFVKNSARIGGAVHVLNADYVFLLRVLVQNNTAEYDGGFAADTDLEGNFSMVDLINISLNSASKWTGGFRFDHAGGMMKNSYFEGNSAAVCGAFFDFTWAPTNRNTSFCVFKNNSAIARGGAYTCFHILHKSRFADCIFIQNFCNMSAYAISIESIDSRVSLERCIFDGPRDQQVRMRFGESNLTIADDCKFEITGKPLLDLFDEFTNPILRAIGKPGIRKL